VLRPILGSRISKEYDDCICKTRKLFLPCRCSDWVTGWMSKEPWLDFRQGQVFNIFCKSFGPLLLSTHVTVRWILENLFPW
jgi:hypothetical protein